MMRTAAAALLLAPLAAWAEPACFVSYQGFEETVRHMDLDTCPGVDMKPEEGFCRLALFEDRITIYVFRHMEGQPCLAAAQRYEANEFIGRFGAVYQRP